MPFIAVNCANIGGDTAVSTLFGHKKGSFTGAEATENGLIGEADGVKRHGTLAAAAEALSTPKSTFSARKRKLEIEIGE